MPLSAHSMVAWLSPQAQWEVCCQVSAGVQATRKTEVPWCAMAGDGWRDPYNPKGMGISWEVPSGNLT